MGALLDEWSQISATRLHDFNRLDDAGAREVLRGCLDVDRWIDTIIIGRPYGSIKDLLDTARLAAKPLIDSEVEQVCPRRSDASAAIRAVQLPQTAPLPAGLACAARTHLAECLSAYEKRFGRPFVIRRAGRSSTELMAKLEARLVNDPQTETRVIAGELRQIALLRLANCIPA